MNRRARSAGSKPLVAFTNQESARENIEGKCKLLEVLVAKSRSTMSLVDNKDAQWQALLPSLPASLRQFNAWTSDDLPTELRSRHNAFGSNAQSTLKKSGLVLRVQKIVDLVEQLRKEPAPLARKEERLAGLRRSVKLSNQLRQIAEREVIALKISEATLKTEVMSLKRKIIAAEREGAAGVQRALSRVAELEAALALPSSNVISFQATGKKTRR